MAISQGFSDILAKQTGAPQKLALAQNYLDFTTAADGWAKQYLPEVMAGEAEVFGNRTISGFLERVGAEEAMQSDQVIWSEQSRLHIKTTGAMAGAGNAIDTIPAGHALRVADTVVISGPNDEIIKARITDVAATSIIVQTYTHDTLINAGLTDNDVVTIFVYGSEFTKGVSGRDESINPQHLTYTNKPIIIKDKYHVDGSDTAQIGWVEVSGEDGQSGYYWYLKADGDTRQRFTDYCEMSMVEAVKKSGSSPMTTTGTEGLFAAIEDRGLISDGVDGTATQNLAEFDLILQEFDKQGAIEENMLYVNRATALKVDDMLAGLAPQVGVGYGVFNNSENMALNLGFTGFRRGSYDFYKTDWKYLNDPMTRGGLTAANTSLIRGVNVPAGTSSVYDESLGKNLKRPFLHVRYRASAADDRRFKSFITGSVGGNVTSSLDAMEVHYLSERCLVVQGANNFLLLKG